MKVLAIASLAAALVLGVSSVAVPTSVAAAQAKKAKPVRKPAPVMRPAVPQDDQSYLFSGPGGGKGVPDYITSGSRNFNQPWYMTNQDRIGSW